MVNNPYLEKAYDEKALLDFLISALPQGYTITISTLDAQPNLGVQEKLTILQNREDTLRKESELAMAAKQTTATPKAICVFCEEPHKATDCSVRKALLKLVNRRRSLPRATKGSQKHRYHQTDRH